MYANNRFEAIRKAAMQLDLSTIKAKLMHAASGEGWSREKADAVEREYRRFLCLMTAFPDEQLAPLVDVDTFWHYHILDTMKYASDCQQAFGYFLHHYPYLGLGGEDDQQVRVDTGERTRTLYEAMFGEAMGLGPCEPVRTDTVATAWCAGPGAAGTIAWCAGPGAKPVAVGGSTAWCAGPGNRLASQVTATSAWCAGPGVKMAGRDSAAMAA